MTAVINNRCQRCGTLIRNQRPVCPSCGLDLVGGAAAPGANEEVVQARGIRQVAAKAGVRMCAICMTSVPEAELVDFEGQQICPQCAESVQKKAARRAGMGGPEGDAPPPSNYAPPRALPPEAMPASASLPGSAAAVRAKSGGAGSIIAKVFLYILAVLNIVGGGWQMLSAGSFGRFTGAVHVFIGLSLITGFGLFLSRILLGILIAIELGLAAFCFLVMPPAIGFVFAVIFGVSFVLDALTLWLSFVVHKK